MMVAKNPIAMVRAFLYGMFEKKDIGKHSCQGSGVKGRLAFPDALKDVLDGN